MIWLGIGCVLASLVLTGYNLYDSHRAGQASEEIAAQLEALLPAASPAEASVAQPAKESSGSEDAAQSAAEPVMNAEEADYLVVEDQSYREMPVLELDGERYIGLLDIPSLERRFPVMENRNYERLKVSPCRYSGSYYANNLVICAHNYLEHFGFIRSLSVKTDVYFTTADGTVIHYMISNITTLQPTSVEQMTKNQADGAVALEDWDLTLFTCTPGAQARYAVRCVRVDDTQ